MRDHFAGNLAHSAPRTPSARYANFMINAARI